MDEFIPNSHKSKQTPVTTGKIKKKNGLQKLTDIFITEDINSVGDLIIHDIVIPYIKKIISERIQNGIDMILYGETGASKKKSYNNSYNEFYDRKRQDRDKPFQRNKIYNPNDIVIGSRKEAEDVLSKLDELIDIYGMASVADFYELVGVSGSYTDNKYGWTDIRTLMYAVSETVISSNSLVLCRLTEVRMKGYFTSYGYMGFVGDIYILFADESDYYDFFKEKEIF